MTILQIERPIFDCDAWKKVFDCVFDTPVEAEGFLAKMRDAWKRAVGQIIESPRARISVVAEAKQY